MDLPFYNLNVNVNITGIREVAKVNNVSLNNLLIFLTIRSINKIENFRYRLRENSVVLHESLHPSFAHIKAGDDLFSMITVDFHDNFIEFDLIIRKEIENTVSYFNLNKLACRDDFVFISPIPWISFTATDHTLNLKKEDAIPRITWGKYFEDNGRILLPYNIQVNHIFVDGLHVGQFFEELENQIAAIKRNLA
jgi:chloramphenicol O-acetyltransferase type A